MRFLWIFMFFFHFFFIFILFWNCKKHNTTESRTSCYCVLYCYSIQIVFPGFPYTIHSLFKHLRRIFFFSIRCIEKERERKQRKKFTLYIFFFAWFLWKWMYGLVLVISDVLPHCDFTIIIFFFNKSISLVFPFFLLLDFIRFLFKIET